MNNNELNKSTADLRLVKKFQNDLPKHIKDEMRKNMEDALRKNMEESYKNKLKTCENCGSHKVIMFDSDNDLCEDCRSYFPGT